METRIGLDWAPNREQIRELLDEFAVLLRRAPFRNKEGLRGVSAFALFYFLRQVQPTIVFEVGVWKGFGTWLIEQAVPTAEIHCFDPIFMLPRYLHRWKIGRLYRPGRARYSIQDFSCAPIAELATGHARPLVFFDDHQNKLPRLHQARAAGIRDIVFDDNMAGLPTHRTLEDERADPAGAAILDTLIERYEIFPPLWPVELHIPGFDISEPGLGFPVSPHLDAIYRDRAWHSYVTYVRLSQTPPLSGRD